MNRRYYSPESYLRLTLFVLSAALIFQDPAPASEFHQNATRILHFDADPAQAKTLVVSTSNGDITVTGLDTDRVVIDAEINVNGRNGETCEELAKRVRIEAKRHNERLIVDPDLPRKIGYSISISYQIIMPNHIGVDLESTNGDLSLANANGDSRLETTNGSINAMNVKGTLSTSSVNGSIFLTKIISSRVTAETVNGHIECQCVGQAPDRIEISTVNGGIDVTLPKGANAALSAETVNGGLYISTGLGEITSKSRGSIQMSIGNGAGEYEISSVNGRVNIVVANPPD